MLLDRAADFQIVLADLLVNVRFRGLTHIGHHLIQECVDSLMRILPLLLVSVVDELEPVAGSVLGIDEAIKRLCPCVQVCEPLFKELLNDLVESCRADILTKQIHLNVALDHLEGVVEGLGVALCDLNDFLGDHFGLARVDHCDELADPT